MNEETGGAVDCAGAANTCRCIRLRVLPCCVYAITIMCLGRFHYFAQNGWTLALRQRARHSPQSRSDLGARCRFALCSQAAAPAASSRPTLQRLKQLPQALTLKRICLIYSARRAHRLPVGAAKAVMARNSRRYDTMATLTMLHALIYGCMAVSKRYLECSSLISFA
jgi:hypothetical protein